MNRQQITSAIADISWVRGNMIGFDERRFNDCLDRLEKVKVLLFKELEQQPAETVK
jgi:hypothetical protein